MPTGAIAGPRRTHDCGGADRRPPRLPGAKAKKTDCDCDYDYGSHSWTAIGTDACASCCSCCPTSSSSASCRARAPSPCPSVDSFLGAPLDRPCASFCSSSFAHRRRIRRGRTPPMMTRRRTTRTSGRHAHAHVHACGRVGGAPCRLGGSASCCSTSSYRCHRRGGRGGARGRRPPWCRLFRVCDLTIRIFRAESGKWEMRATNPQSATDHINAIQHRTHSRSPDHGHRTGEYE